MHKMRYLCIISIMGLKDPIWCLMGWPNRPSHPWSSIWINGSQSPSQSIKRVGSNPNPNPFPILSLSILSLLQEASEGRRPSRRRHQAPGAVGGGLARGPALGQGGGGGDPCVCSPPRPGPPRSGPLPWPVQRWRCVGAP